MPNIHPGPGGFKMTPDPQYDRPPYWMDVFENDLVFRDFDFHDYYWDSVEQDFRFTTSDGLRTFGYTCTGSSTYTHWSMDPAHPLMPPVMLETGTCEPG